MTLPIELMQSQRLGKVSRDLVEEIPYAGVPQPY